MEFLDVSTLPTTKIWNAGTVAPVDLEAVTFGLKYVIDDLMEYGYLAERDSFGFALADPRLGDPVAYKRLYGQLWDDPHRLIYLVVHWGPNGPMLAANAVRKIRPAARLGLDTQVIRIDQPESFQDQVEKVEPDGQFRWGDFPYDGATFNRVIDRVLLGAVSTFPKEEDPVVAQMILGHVGLKIYESDQKVKQSAA